MIGALNAPPAPFVPQQHHFAPGYALLLTGFGSAPSSTPRLADQIRRAASAAVRPRHADALRRAAEAARRGQRLGLLRLREGAPTSTTCPTTSSTSITEQVPRKTSPMSVVLFYRLDGAYSQVGDDETAFGGGRSPRYGAFIIGLAPDAGLLDADRGLGPRLLGRAAPARHRQRGRLRQRASPTSRPTGSAAATARPSTTGSPGSRPSTTRTTSSTSTPTSCPLGVERRFYSPPPGGTAAP